MSKVCQCDPATWNLEILKTSPICEEYKENFDDMNCLHCLHDKACHKDEPGAV